MNWWILRNFAIVKIIRTSWLPFKGFVAMNVFGMIFVHPGTFLSSRTINHERIHTAQMRELGFLLFYVLYVIEWVVRLLMHGNAYRHISFEREAYSHDGDLQYLKHRRHFAQWRSIKKCK